MKTINGIAVYINDTAVCINDSAVCKNGSAVYSLYLYISDII